jgi:hypothetical protein
VVTADYKFLSISVAKLLNTERGDPRHCTFPAAERMLQSTLLHQGAVICMEDFMRLISRFMLMGALLGLFVMAGRAAEKPQDGKALYRNNCKVCHDKGSAHGVYTPMTLTQDQWRKFFSTKLFPAHKSAIHPKENKKLLELVGPDQLKSIQRFCIDHAADSEQPATCG